MSLHPTPRGEVPAGTAAVARVAFPGGNRCLDLRDALGPIFEDRQFAELFAVCGRPAECPWRLALVTLLQFAEDLSDRRAADAVRGRIDWKHLLGLELGDPGFDASVLSELKRPAHRGRGCDAAVRYPARSVPGAGVARGGVAASATCSTHVLGAVRALNRLDCAIESLRAALNALAVAEPEWLRAHGLSGLDRPLRLGHADDIHAARGAGLRAAPSAQAGRARWARPARRHHGP